MQKLFFIPALAPIVLGFVLCHADKRIRKSDRNHIVVYLPKIYLWIGCIAASIFLLGLLLMERFPNESTTLGVKVEFSFFLLLGLFIVYHRQAWRIDVFRNEDCFYYRSLSMKTYKISYSDCIGYKYGIALLGYSRYALILKTKSMRKKFYIDCKARNFEAFLSVLDLHRVKKKAIFRNRN